MKIFFTFLLTVIKLYIIFKVGFLLYFTMSDPTNYPIDKLTWWIYFLVFEIWLFQTLKDLPKNEDD